MCDESSKGNGRDVEQIDDSFPCEACETEVLETTSDEWFDDKFVILGQRVRLFGVIVHELEGELGDVKDGVSGALIVG